MKKIILLANFLLILSFYNLYGQEEKTINITPELSYVAINNNKINFQSLLFNYKEIDYPIYIEGEVHSKKYDEELKKLNEFKEEFEKYEELHQKAEQDYNEIKSISSLIDNYLNSKEKKEIKEKYLADAQKIIDKNNLQTNFSSGNVYNPDVKIILTDIKIKKDDLKFYQSYIQKIKFDEPKKPQGYNNYISQLKKLESINPTEKGSILSNETIKKHTYIIDSLSVVTYKDLNGLFYILPDRYHIKQHQKNNFIKFELISDSELSSSEKINSKSFPLIKSSNSDKYYLLISDYFLTSLEKENSKEKVYFTFVKSTVSKLEQSATTKNSYEFETPELKKRMTGMFLIEQIDEKVNYEKNQYIKFSSIASDEKFMMITDSEYGHKKYEENLIIQNVKSKKMYVVSAYAMRKFQDYSNMANEKNGNGWLTKLVSKERTLEEKELISRYKALITNGEGKTKILYNIQKRNLTRGYFDSSKVNSSDKITYNKTIDELNNIYKKLQDIYLYEDKNSIAELSLTMDELATYFLVKDWHYKAQKI